mgnify:CR=1 FL=1
MQAQEEHAAPNIPDHAPNTAADVVENHAKVMRPSLNAIMPAAEEAEEVAVWEPEELEQGDLLMLAKVKRQAAKLHSHRLPGEDEALVVPESPTYYVS